MSGFPRDYAKPMMEKFSFLVTWPPDARLKLGDYGLITGKKEKGKAPFDRRGNIRDDFGVRFNVRKGARADVHELQSGDVSITEIKGSAKQTDAAVEFAIGFSKKHTFLYRASDVYVSEIEEKQRVGKELAKLLKGGKWDKHWVVVTDLHVAGGLLVLLSNEKDNKVTVTGNAKLKRSNLADATAEVSVLTATKSFMKSVSSEETTPLLQARKINKKGEFKVEPGALVLPRLDDALALEDDLQLVGVDIDYCELESV